MKFYYNPNINICAEELWVLDFLVLEYKIRDIEEGQEWLKTHDYIFGWHECGVSATIEEAMNGLQIRCDGWDAICHSGSYGHERGLIEVMGLPQCDGDVIGYLTAEEVLAMVDSPAKS